MEKREPYCTVSGNAAWCGHCGKQYGISPKSKNELPFDLASLLLEIYPKNPESSIQKNVYAPMLLAALFTIAKCCKQPKFPSVNEWIKKLRYIYTMEYYAAERKKELLPFTTAWMELESVMLNEISQLVKDKYHIISPVRGI